jgi:S1-C subfamily serine protease
MERMKKRQLLLIALGLLILPGRALPDDASLKKSVVKIFTVTNRPNYYKPWERGYQYNTSGSGCVLPGNLVLTNAHVVSDAVFLQVMKAGDTQKFTAKVEYVDHDREVAVLKVEDADFFKGTIPVQYGDLPSQRDKVAVYGFPIGGDELSITEGVVSRIEVQLYTHSQRHFLATQTDAAINAGNSGGPAFKGGKMVGVAFQAYGKAENTGYIVPMEVIRESLQDWKEGVLDGPPSLGIYWQKMESPSLKAYYRMKQVHSGVLVTKILYGSPAAGILEVEDVVLSVGGVSIADNGTVKFR